MALLVRPIEGPINGVIEKLSTMPQKQAMAAVLRAISEEVGEAHVEVPPNANRALLKLADGTRATVRVTSARQAHPNGVPMLRFKPPLNAAEYSALYFGGLDRAGRAVVHKLTARQIGTKRTLTLRCGAA